MATRYTLEDLAREAGIGRRTLRSYLSRGALPRPPHRGPLPAYDEAFLRRLKAAVSLRRQGVAIDDLAKRLSAMRAEEMAYLAGEGPPPPPKPVAPLGGERAGAPGGTPGGTEVWERTRLVPGVELHVAAGADEAAQRVARAIQTMFGPGK